MTWTKLPTSVQLYERSQFANEVGAAIHVGPNADLVLQMLGFDHKRAGLMAVEEVEIPHYPERKKQGSNSAFRAYSLRRPR